MACEEKLTCRTAFASKEEANGSDSGKVEEEEK